MPKNIVILCDGTSNEISRNRTNILRLYGCLERSDRQVVFYDPGVGTFGGEGIWSSWVRRASEIWGLLTGQGLDANVMEAYRFLMDHYEPGDPDKPDAGDQVHILGFSRGAYAARILAGFIHAFGLVDRTQINLLPYAYRAYKRIGENAKDPDNERAATTPFAEVRLFERALAPQRVPIRSLGLFDTVASVIESGRFGPRLRSHAFTRTNLSVMAVRHAVAIHERRVMFRPRLWPEGGKFRRNRFDEKGEIDQDVKEVWFRGVHGDIGGGYPEPDSAIAKVPLEWMIDETRDLGLIYKTRTVNRIVKATHKDTHYVAPDAAKRPHDSMGALWKILEILPTQTDGTYGRKGLRLGRVHIPLCQPRVIPNDARIHRTVIEAAEGRGKRLPSNVPADHRVEG